ncbi:MAG TPA: hypothetical protein VLS93_05260 [Anaeromyxobacteraceae bacterium]|nr:hypothetical protein [Anaeromyxobacteraceae bacterium]
MNVHTALAIAALAGSIALFVGSASRILAVIALIASGLEVAMALGLLHLSVAGIPLRLVLGLCLAVPGVMIWLRASGKNTVAASTVVALVGILQVLLALGVRV